MHTRTRVCNNDLTDVGSERDPDPAVLTLSGGDPIARVVEEVVNDLHDRCGTTPDREVVTLDQCLGVCRVDRMTVEEKSEIDGTPRAGWPHPVNSSDGFVWGK